MKHCDEKCFHDFPDFCPPPSKPPIPCNPPVPSVVQGTSLYEAVNNLTNRVNVCINTYNDVMRNCYATLHNLEKAAEENGAYYSPCDVYTEEGYSADEGATYTLIHKNVVDRRGEPIRVKLHLAYGNTTNSKIQQGLFSASKITYADKIVIAQPMGENGWYGKPIWNGCPIPGADAPNLYTMGFTRSGVMKVYSNSVSTDQMLRDTVEDAMGVSGVLIMNGQITDDSYTTNIPNAKEQTSRVCVGQNLDTREVIFLVCGNENNVNKKGLTTKACANILLQYGCDIAVELCEGSSAGAMDKGSLMFVPENNEIPEGYCFWYISRACFYRSDYERELAELMQNYGQCIWNTYLNKKDIDNLQTDLENEINNRIEADNALKAEDERIENKLDEEIATRTESDERFQAAITDLQTRMGKAETDITNLKSLYNGLQEQTSTMDEAITSIQTTITSIETSLNNLKQTVEDIRNGTIQLNYLSLSGGTMAGAINMNNNKITNLPEPTSNQDAATKAYVDSHSGGGGGTGNYVSKAGDTMTGALNITMGGKEISISNATIELDNGTEIVSVGEVEGANNANVYGLSSVNNLTLVTNGAVNLTNSTGGAVGITNVLTPTGANDAVNKTYVDNAVASAGDGKFLPLTGGTVTGNTTFNSELNNNNIIKLTNKNYITPATEFSASKIYQRKRSETSAEAPELVIEAPNSDRMRLNVGYTMFPNQVNISSQTENQLSVYANTVSLNNNPYTIVKNVGDPISDHDAVNKQYVDNAISSAGGGDFKADGSVVATGDFNMGLHKITNLAMPVEGTDAASRNFVFINFLPKTGGTLTGNLKVAADSATVTVEGNSGAGMVVSGATNGGIPTGELIVQDSNQSNSSYIRLTASATGNEIACDSRLVINANEVGVSNQRITDVATPTANTDAANKAYVDSKVGGSNVISKYGSFTSLNALDVTFTEYNASKCYWCNIFIAIYSAADQYNEKTLTASGMINRGLSTKLYLCGQILDNSSKTVGEIIPIPLTLANNALKIDFEVQSGSTSYSGDYCITIQELGASGEK